ncbi:shieldin complex subunit 1 isoform X1 [Anolis carolinensis]
MESWELQLGEPSLAEKAMQVLKKDISQDPIAPSHGRSSGVTLYSFPGVDAPPTSYKLDDVLCNRSTQEVRSAGALPLGSASGVGGTFHKNKRKTQRGIRQLRSEAAWISWRIPPPFALVRSEAAMEESRATSSCQSEESSLLDIPCVVTAEDFALISSPGRKGEIPSSVDEFVSLTSTSIDTEPNSTDFMEYTTGGGVTLWPRSCVKAESTNCVNSEQFHNSELPLSWAYEQKNEGETAIRKSLEMFYGTCCQRMPFGGSPAFEAASQSVSTKIAELAGKEGTEYTLKSLRVAQMVLNREREKMFPQHSSDACFSTATKAGFGLEEAKDVPGLSDDILQFILKQKTTK